LFCIQIPYDSVSFSKPVSPENQAKPDKSDVSKTTKGDPGSIGAAKAEELL